MAKWRYTLELEVEADDLLEASKVVWDHVGFSAGDKVRFVRQDAKRSGSDMCFHGAPGSECVCK